MVKSRKKFIMIAAVIFVAIAIIIAASISIAIAVSNPAVHSAISQFCAGFRAGFNGQ